MAGPFFFHVGHLRDLEVHPQLQMKPLVLYFQWIQVHLSMTMRQRQENGLNLIDDHFNFEWYINHIHSMVILKQMLCKLSYEQNGLFTLFWGQLRLGYEFVSLAGSKLLPRSSYNIKTVRKWKFRSIWSRNDVPRNILMMMSSYDNSCYICYKNAQPTAHLPLSLCEVWHTPCDDPWSSFVVIHMIFPLQQLV